MNISKVNNNLIYVDGILYEWDEEGLEIESYMDIDGVEVVVVEGCFVNEITREPLVDTRIRKCPENNNNN